MTSSSKRDEFGRFAKKNSDTNHLPELPNENPDIGKEGLQPNVLAAASDRPTPGVRVTPTAVKPPTKIISDDIAGIWHMHKKQGRTPAPATISASGETFAMVIPTDEFTCRLLIRVDLRDASALATSITSIEMGSEDAMKLLAENYIQTQFFISNPSKKI
jgi:hypothetical protein